MKKNILQKLRLFLRTLFFLIGIMTVPILVLDRILPQKDFTMLWWAVVFSVILTAIDSIFDWIPVFREKLLLKRIFFFIVFIAALMGSELLHDALFSLTLDLTQNDRNRNLIHGRSSYFYSFYSLSTVITQK